MRAPQLQVLSTHVYTRSGGGCAGGGGGGGGNDACSRDVTGVLTVTASAVKKWKAAPRITAATSACRSFTMPQELQVLRTAPVAAAAAAAASAGIAGAPVELWRKLDMCFQSSLCVTLQLYNQPAAGACRMRTSWSPSCTDSRECCAMCKRRLRRASQVWG